MNSVEDFWDGLLSRDPIRIKKTYEDLGEIDQQAVVDHLIIMTTENGWHSSQIKSAKIALETIKKYFK